MSDSEDFEVEEDLPLNQDPEYSDLIPIPQDDGPNPVVLIRYTNEFTLVHNYFRALLARDEKSERALKLTSKVIKLNSANYTAWQYRRDIIFTLDLDLFQELEFCRKVAVKSPKNYQLWWHRRLIIQAINDPSSSKNGNSNCSESTNNNTNESTSDIISEQKEMSGKKSVSFAYDMRLEKELIRKILKSDAKNYHAWSHLHWILRAYPHLFDDELQYLEKELLRLDIRNNSAWNHRHFVICNTVTYSTMDVLQKEIDFCRLKIGKVVNNDSVWYYYSDLILKQLKTFAFNCNANDVNVNGNDAWIDIRLEQIEWVRKLLETHPYCNRAVLFYVDLLTEETFANEEGLEQAIELLQLLASKLDRIRHKYYKYLIIGVEKKLTALSNKN